ncbi:MAG: CotH protein [Verrucomicrobiales bacterium]|nr:CotH protein [Verrucomicrobiales bacterium]
MLRFCRLTRNYCVRLLDLTIATFICLNVIGGDFVPAGASWRFFKGTQEPTPGNLSTWRAIDFDDSSWGIGPMPVFYGEPLTGTEVADMRGNYTSIYFRYSFNVTNPADIETLTLRVLSDDGFSAWINGNPIDPFNAPPGDAPYNATAFTTFTEPLPYDDYPISNPASVLRPGKNLICIHGFNASLSGSSDFVMDPSLSFTQDESAPILDRILPLGGARLRQFSSVEIDFSEAVDGVEAADLLINGQAATNVVEITPGQFVFAFPEPPAGSVQLSFRPNHGITDRAATPHPFAGGSWSYILDPNAPVPGILISEFMADNHRSLKDNDGNSPDWIEIYNSSSENVGLAGWSLTDTATNLIRWRFPAVSLSPNSFMVVFASGRDTNRLGQLHTNFKLTSDAAGFLALVNPSGETISAFTNYPAQKEDVSYGRANGAPDTIGYFSKPTPGNPNSDQGSGFGPAVEFSETSRTFLGTLSVTLSTTNSPAVIHFTTDGTIPTESSPVFNQALALTTATQIRARAFVSGFLPGPLRSETFVPLSNPVASFTSDLPVLLIDDFNAGRPPANVDIFAAIQVFEPNTNGVTSMTNHPSLATRAVIAARGSSTESYPKVSMKVEFQDEFGFSKDLPLLDLPSESDWVLYAPNNYEPILIHNAFAQTLGRDIGAESVRTRFVEVYLVQSGLGAVTTASYNGIYVLEEKIKIGDHRVQIPKLDQEDILSPQVTGGYLMKIDRPDPGDSGFGAANQSIDYLDPKEFEIKTSARAPQRNYLQSYMDALGNALYGPNFRNPTNGYRAYIDAPSWIDHHLVNVLTFNVDALRLSAYFFKPRQDKLRFGPLWDFDRSLNSTDGRDANPRVWRSQSSDLGTDFFNYTWWNRLFQDPDFYQEYIDRYQELRTSDFSTTNLWRLTDELANKVRKAQPREQSRWGVTPRGGFQGEINSLKTWLSNRVDFMDSQFVKHPALSETNVIIASGSTVSLTVPTGASVYYTLDGVDPRLAQSALGTNVSPAAKLYSGPITITNNVRLVARARNPNHTALTGANNPPLKSIWSGTIERTFVVNPLPIAVTEIMFHPPSDGLNTGFDSDDFEFIELKNTGVARVSMNGFQLDGAIHFTFTATNAITSLAPGERLVLVKNRAAFGSRYLNVTNIAGEYSGNLSNGGERIALSGPLQEPVFDFHYLDTWQPQADGNGPSLVLINETVTPENFGDPAQWKASVQFGGSPGAPEPLAPTLSISIQGNTLSIRCVGAPAVPYTLQQIDDLSSTAWQTIEQVTAPASGIIQVTAPAPLNNRFYRMTSP